MIASKTIIFITSFFLISFGLMNLRLLIKNPNNRGLKYLWICFLLFILGIILTSLRNKIGTFMSLQLGLMAFGLGCQFLYMGLRNLLGFYARWHNRYLILLALLCFGIFLFTYVYYDLHMRIVIFSLYISGYTFIIAWLFYDASFYRDKRLNRLASVAFVFFAILFLLRTLNATAYGYDMDVTYSNIFIVNTPYAALSILSILLMFISYRNAQRDCINETNFI